MNFLLFYRIAADILQILHMMVVLFIVAGLLLVLAGGVRGWSWVRNPWFRLAHVIAIGVVVVQAWAGVICTLTVWEQALRQRAGNTAYSGSFIVHWLLHDSGWASHARGKFFAPGATDWKAGEGVGGQI